MIELRLTLGYDFLYVLFLVQCIICPTIQFTQIKLEYFHRTMTLHPAKIWNRVFWHLIACASNHLDLSKQTNPLHTPRILHLIFTTFICESSPGLCSTWCSSPAPNPKFIPTKYLDNSLVYQHPRNHLPILYWTTRHVQACLLRIVDCRWAGSWYSTKMPSCFQIQLMTQQERNYQKSDSCGISIPGK